MEKNLLRVEKKLLGQSAYSLVTIPTALSRLHCVIGILLSSAIGRHSDRAVVASLNVETIQCTVFVDKISIIFINCFHLV